MQLQSLRLLSFRNYREQELTFSKPINIFVGDNGQGKTNLLESIQLALGGSPFRGAETLQFILKGEEQARIKALFNLHQSFEQVEVQIQNQQKVFLMNEKKVQRSQLWKKFGSVTFSPESLKIIKAGPSERRAFIDGLTISIQPQTWSLYSQYLKCLKQRNQQLRLMKEGAQDKKSYAVLENLTENFLRLAAEITVLRLSSIQKLNQKIRFRTEIESKNLFLN